MVRRIRTWATPTSVVSAKKAPDWSAPPQHPPHPRVSTDVGRVMRAAPTPTPALMSVNWNMGTESLPRLRNRRSPPADAPPATNRSRLPSLSTSPQTAPNDSSSRPPSTTEDTGRKLPLPTLW